MIVVLYCIALYVLFFYDMICKKILYCTNSTRASRGRKFERINAQLINFRAEQRLCLQVAGEPCVLRSSNLSSSRSHAIISFYYDHFSFLSDLISSHLVSSQFHPSHFHLISSHVMLRLLNVLHHFSCHLISIHVVCALGVLTFSARLQKELLMFT